MEGDSSDEFIDPNHFEMAARLSDLEDSMDSGIEDKLETGEVGTYTGIVKRKEDERTLSEDYSKQTVIDR